MSARSSRLATPAAAGLLGSSILLTVGGTWLHVRVSGTTLPVGTQELAPVTLLWAMLAFSIVGSVVAMMRPANPIGWLLASIGVLWQVDQVAGSARVYSGFARPDAVGGDIAAWIFDVAWIGPLCALPLVLVLMPDGRLPSPRWWPVPTALAGAAVALAVAVGLRPGPLTSTPSVDNPFGVDWVSDSADVLEGLGGMLLAAATVAALVALVLRYRAGTATVRQQLKWVLLSFALVVATLTVGSALEAMGVDSRTLAIVRTLPLVLVPAACGIAVVRHQLFDIDLVINKLLLYGVLMGGIAGLYFAVVVGVGHLVGTSGEPNVALAVVATAIAAVAFDPARRALQRVTNRLVYGTRATPYDTLAAVSRRVGAWHDPGELLDRMARAIADATGGRGEVWVAGAEGLTLAAAWPADGELGSGSPPAPPTSPRSEVPPTQAAFAVHHGGQQLGALTVTKPRGEALTSSEHRLLDDLAGSAAFVLENARLLDELRASRQRLVAAQDSERRHVERDLHDGAQQRLLELALTLRRLERQLGESPAVAILCDALDQLHQALAELRDLARGIHPAILTEQGLDAALRSLATRLPVAVELDLAIARRLDGPVESTVYFLASEALANVVKHAGDHVQIRLTARCDDEVLHVEVTDDGRGGADPNGSGLQGLADRVAALDGRFLVESPPGSGTRIVAELPCR